MPQVWHVILAVGVIVLTLLFVCRRIIFLIDVILGGCNISCFCGNNADVEYGLVSFSVPGPPLLESGSNPGSQPIEGRGLHFELLLLPGSQSLDLVRPLVSPRGWLVAPPFPLLAFRLECQGRVLLN